MESTTTLKKGPKCQNNIQISLLDEKRIIQYQKLCVSLKVGMPESKIKKRKKKHPSIAHNIKGNKANGP